MQKMASANRNYKTRVLFSRESSKQGSIPFSQSQKPNGSMFLPHQLALKWAFHPCFNSSHATGLPCPASGPGCNANSIYLAFMLNPWDAVITLDFDSWSIIIITLLVCVCVGGEDGRIARLLFSTPCFYYSS